MSAPVKLTASMRRALEHVDEHGFLRLVVTQMKQGIDEDDAVRTVHRRTFERLRRERFIEYVPYPGRDFSAWKRSDAGRAALAASKGDK